MDIVIFLFFAFCNLAYCKDNRLDKFFIYFFFAVGKNF